MSPESSTEQKPFPETCANGKCQDHEPDWENVGTPQMEQRGNKTYFFNKCCGQRIAKYRKVQRQQCRMCGNTRKRDIGARLGKCHCCGKTKIFLDGENDPNEPSTYNRNPHDESRHFYEAPHKLRKVFVRDDEITVHHPGHSNFSAGFFLILGSVTSSHTEGTETKQIVTHVRFAWEIEDETYIITTLPLEKIRIKLVASTTTPTVSFFLDRQAIWNATWELTHYRSYQEGKNLADLNIRRVLDDHFNPHQALSRYLAYVTITVSENDWPTNINLPMNKGYSE